MIFLLSTLLTAVAMVLFYGMVFSIWGESMTSLLGMKKQKALVIIVAGVVLIVWIQLWIEEVLSSYMEAG